MKTKPLTPGQIRINITKCILSVYDEVSDLTKNLPKTFLKRPTATLLVTDILNGIFKNADDYGLGSVEKETYKKHKAIIIKRIVNELF